MIAVSEIEHAVAGLSREELSAFRDWFEEFDAAAWDKQFADDVAAGRLDALAAEALSDFSVTEDEMKLLDARLADLDQNPEDQIPWAEVKASLLRQL